MVTLAFSVPSMTAATSIWGPPAGERLAPCRPITSLVGPPSYIDTILNRLTSKDVLERLQAQLFVS
jgi:hypothetical protein